MKITELFEGQMLLESYKDYKRVFITTLQNLYDDDVSRIKLRWSSSSNNMGLRRTEDFPDFLEKMLRNQRYVSLLKSPTPYTDFEHSVAEVKNSTKIRNLTDISSWVSNLSSASELAKGQVIGNHIIAASILMGKLEEEIANRTPDYTTVAKTSSYIIFDVKNFAAAEKLRNQVGATWCIGANEGMFRSYGEDKGRKTYIVFLLKTKKGMVVHVTPNNPYIHLITSHSNKSDGVIVRGGLKYNRGVGEIELDLNDAMSADEIVELFEVFRITYSPDTRSTFPPQILASFMRDLNDNEVNASRSSKDTARFIKREYADIYNSGEMMRVVNFIEVNIEECLVEIDSGYDAQKLFKINGDDIKTITSNLTLISVIATHVKALSRANILPIGAGPSDQIVDIVEKLLSYIERDQTLPEAYPHVIKEIERFRSRLGDIRSRR